MKFVANVDFNGGQLRPLDKSDVDAIVKLYHKQTLAGQSESAIKEHAERMITLSVQMAATQRGLMWAIEVGGEMLGMLSLYDWQPTSLKTLLRLDALPELAQSLQVNALRSGMDYLAQKYHLRNFSFQCLPQGEDTVIDVITRVGFEEQARLRDFRRLSQTEFADIVVFNKILEPAGSTEQIGEPV
ncbi:MAG: RimJ/RimL family protein N-acetyltransferase [Oleispira sp.]|jgi:RimJ/RimL family protein N-acetyltransferase